MIIKIPTLARMNRLVVEFIFNKKAMPDAQKTELLEGIDQWRRRRYVPAAQAKEIDLVIAAIADDSKGRFKKIKEELKRHKLDYRKVFKDGL